MVQKSVLGYRRVLNYKKHLLYPEKNGNLEITKSVDPKNEARLPIESDVEITGLTLPLHGGIPGVKRILCPYTSTKHEIPKF